MQIRDIMTQPVISIAPEESVEVAARTLTHYNIGILPVCDSRGNLQGLVTDRDLVTRCMASGRTPAETRVRDVMTGNTITITPDMTIGGAAELMGSRQVRRLPVTEDGKLLGMVSLGDVAKHTPIAAKAAAALSKISRNTSDFGG